MKPSYTSTQPLIQNSRLPHHSAVASTNDGASAAGGRPPPEILNFIEKQEGYIEQLERESQFCRVSVHIFTLYFLKTLLI